MPGWLRTNSLRLLTSQTLQDRLILPPSSVKELPMTTRLRILLASLAVASISHFAMAEKASAFELLDQLLNKGGSACGCDAGSAKVSQKGGGKSAPCSTSSKSGGSCCCGVGTPVLDAMSDFTRTVKCHFHSLPRFEMPCIQLPSFDLSGLLPCSRCCSCSSGKGHGKSVTSSYSPAPTGPAYHSPGMPLEAPPAPILDAEA